MNQKAGCWNQKIYGLMMLLEYFYIICNKYIYIIYVCLGWDLVSAAERFVRTQQVGKKYGSSSYWLIDSLINWFID